MSLAILCSGQGRQHGSMFALTGETLAAASLFAHATDLLEGRDPRQFVFTASAAALHDNRSAQILCTLQTLAAMTMLSDAMPRRLVVAGYSVGEIAAWGVSGCFGLHDTLDLVAQRAELMSAAATAGDGLIFIRGLERSTVNDLCSRREAAIAIVEPDDAVVLGGTRAALEMIAEEARGLRAIVHELPVSVASHTSRLAGASSAFREVARKIHVQAPDAGVRLLSGVDGVEVVDIQVGLDKLSAQISHTVQWAACLQSCIEAGASAFLELGPGSALATMVARAYPGVPARSLDDFKSSAGVRAWLVSHVAG
jgi:[acyl-carrier-protein] S-malonyltransferase